MGEQKTVLETALTFSGAVLCRCGTKMQIRERRLFETGMTEFYLLCDNCGMHTAVKTVGSYAPLAEYMQVLDKIRREMKT